MSQALEALLHYASVLWRNSIITLDEYQQITRIVKRVQNKHVN